MMQKNDQMSRSRDQIDPLTLMMEESMNASCGIETNKKSSMSENTNFGVPPSMGYSGEESAFNFKPSQDLEKTRSLYDDSLEIEGMQSCQQLPKSESDLFEVQVPTPLTYASEENNFNLNPAQDLEMNTASDYNMENDDSVSEIGSDEGSAITPSTPQPSFQPLPAATVVPYTETMPTEENSLATPLESSASVQPPGKWSDLVKETDLRTLQGEQVLMYLSNVYFQAYNSDYLKGKLVMTTYRLVFLAEREYGHLPSSFFNLPLSTIDRVDKDRPPNRETIVIGAILIFSKDVRCWKIVLDQGVNPDRVFSALLTYAFPGNIDLLFCHSHRLRPSALVDPGWDIFNEEAEFIRQGVCLDRPAGQASPWRLSHINQNYGLCSSYPKVLVVPAGINEPSLRTIGAFRSASRIPVLSWGRPYDSGSIWRSSQPKVGVSGASCPADEMMLGLIARSSTTDKVLQILDCRPKANAMVNRASGYGFESSTNYTSSRLTFMNIGNIHVMRDAFNKLTQLVLSPNVLEYEWGARVEETGWLGHLRMVLYAAHQVATHVHRRDSPVLIHCSHGWDRTSQVSALAQILLDPYFRTCEGFEILICKDWLAFGHPFQLRQAHGMAKSQRIDDQMSPIFLQFLDAVWQLLTLFPSWFEYNGRYLLCIADHLTSSRFGTFLCNNDKEREKANLSHRTSSLWSYLRLNQKTFLNPYYQPRTRITPEETHLRTKESDEAGVLLPPVSCILRRVQLWGDYFLRYSPKISVPRIDSFLHPYVYGSDIYPTNVMEEVAFEDAFLEKVVCASDEAEGWLRKSQHKARFDSLQAGVQGFDNLKDILESNDEQLELELKSKNQEDLLAAMKCLREVVIRQREEIVVLKERLLCTQELDDQKPNFAQDFGSGSDKNTDAEVKSKDST